MLCLGDCLALCDLTEEQVLAIAHHERIPEIAAVEMGDYLLRTPEGEQRIRNILRDEIAEAAVAGDRGRERALKVTLRDFLLQHPAREEALRREKPNGKGDA